MQSSRGVCVCGRTVSGGGGGGWMEGWMDGTAEPEGLSVIHFCVARIMDKQGGLPKRAAGCNSLNIKVGRLNSRVWPE